MLVSLTQNDGAYDSKYAAFERIRQSKNMVNWASMVFARKMPKLGIKVIDNQTGEEHDTK